MLEFERDDNILAFLMGEHINPKKYKKFDFLINI